MQRKTLLASICAITLLHAGTANAKILEIWGSGLVGGAFGDGKSHRDFFNWAAGGAGGVEVGAKVLFLVAYVDYLRFFGGDVGADLVGINLGGETDASWGLPIEFVFRVAGTYYLGELENGTRSGTNVTSNMVETQGVGLNGSIGIRYPFWYLFSVGVEPTIGYHYFFDGADVAAGSEDSHGWDFRVLGYFRVGLGI